MLTRATPSLSLGLPAVGFPFGAFALAVAFATLWTGLALTQNNLEGQSIDLCHHAMFVDHLQTPLGHADRAVTGLYPILSHRVATLWMPVFHNPIMAVRAAALASVLIMLAAQWYLLRTRFSPSLALLLLVGWQCLCTNCKLGDVNHFLWDFQYNYSRAVSAAALWTMILCFVVPPSRHRFLNLFVIVGLAAFAFRCHIAAGSLALATCGTWCVVNLIRRDWLYGLGGIIAIGVTSALMLAFTDEWRYLASLQNDNGPLPIRHADLVALWIPTAVLGLGMALWLARRGRHLEMSPLVAVLCGLLPAAVLQGYMLYGKNVTHTVGSYPYNQMLFYTFELASLAWILFVSPTRQREFAHSESADVIKPSLARRANMHRLHCRRRMSVDDARNRSAARACGNRARSDPRAERTAPAEGAVRGLLLLRPEAGARVVFSSAGAVLGAGSDYCARYRLHCHLRKPQDLFREPALTALFMPMSVDVDAVLGPNTPRVAVGFVLEVRPGGVEDTMMTRLRMRTPTTTRLCPACAKGQPHRTLYRKWGYPILACRGCGLGRTDAAGFDPASYYTADYFTGRHRDGYGDYVGSADVLRAEFDGIARHVKRLAPGPRLLEVGSAYGYFLEAGARDGLFTRAASRSVPKPSPPARLAGSTPPPVW